jgi:cytochrome c553
MKRVIFAGMVLVSSMFAADGAALYKKCISCHGAAGEKSALGKSKILIEMSLEENITALKGYQDGSYGGPMKALMKGQVANYSDEEIEVVSKYVIELAN